MASRASGRVPLAPAMSRTTARRLRSRRSPARLRQGALQAPLDGRHRLPDRLRRGHRLHIHRDADLRGEDALLIEAENQNVVSLQGSARRNQTRADYYQTQYNILQSRALARRTLTSSSCGTSRLSAARRPGLRPQEPRSWEPRGARLEVSRPVQGRRLAGRRQCDSGADETAAQSRAIDAFAAQTDRRADPQQPAGGRQVSACRMPALATSIVNALARNYIEQSLEFKFMASKEASDWLGARLAEQRKELEGAEAKLQQLPGAERGHRARRTARTSSCRSSRI